DRDRGWVSGHSPFRPESQLSHHPGGRPKIGRQLEASVPRRVRCYGVAADASKLISNRVNDVMSTQNANSTLRARKLAPILMHAQSRADYRSGNVEFPISFIFLPHFISRIDFSQPST